MLEAEHIRKIGKERGALEVETIADKMMLRVSLHPKKTTSSVGGEGEGGDGGDEEVSSKKKCQRTCHTQSKRRE